MKLVAAAAEQGHWGCNMVLWRGGRDAEGARPRIAWPCVSPLSTTRASPGTSVQTQDPQQNGMIEEAPCNFSGHFQWLDVGDRLCVPSTHRCGGLLVYSTEGHVGQMCLGFWWWDGYGGQSVTPAILSKPRHLGLCDLPRACRSR